MCAIRPSTNFMCPLCEDDDLGVERINDSEIMPDSDGMPLLMEEEVTDLDEDVVVQPPRPLPEPKVPTSAQVAAHNLTHLPYRTWCAHCVAARRPNSHHLSASSNSQRSTPLLVADYCFIRDNEDEETATVLVACLYPSRTMLATVVPAKGADDYAIAAVGKEIDVSGLTRMTIKSDQEPAIHSLIQAVRRERPETIECMAPEESPVGESKSNGAVENAIRNVQGQVRTLKLML